MGDKDDESSGFKIQIMSDLHLEFPNALSSLPNIPVTAPILALLGDTGLMNEKGLERVDAFLKRFGSKYERVLILLGNHEFYGSEYYSAIDLAKTLETKYENVRIMHKTALTIKGVRILGTTLWSDVPDQYQEEVGYCLNDYRMIRMNWRSEDGDTRLKRLTVKDTCNMFKNESEWLAKEIQVAAAENCPVLVLTHHAPSLKGTSAPEHEGGPVNTAFASNLEHLIKSPVVAWAFGHTHFNSDQKFNGVRCVSNQLGYVIESKCRKTFQPGFTVCI